MLKRLLGALFCLLLLAPSASAATGLLLNEVPTRWRLQNYLNGNGTSGVVAWYTGSTKDACTAGVLQLPPNSNEGDKNRFWSVVSTAKAHGKRVFVYYDTPSCIVTSFGFAEE